MAKSKVVLQKIPLKEGPKRNKGPRGDIGEMHKAVCTLYDEEIQVEEEFVPGLIYKSQLPKSYLDKVFAKVGEERTPEGAKLFFDTILRRMERIHSTLTQEEIEASLIEREELKYGQNSINRQFHSCMYEGYNERKTMFLKSVLSQCAAVMGLAKKPGYRFQNIKVDRRDLARKYVPDFMVVKNHVMDPVLLLVKVVDHIDIVRVIKAQSPYVLGEQAYILVKSMYHFKARVGIVFDGSYMVLCTIKETYLKAHPPSPAQIERFVGPLPLVNMPLAFTVVAVKTTDMPVCVPPIYSPPFVEALAYSLIKPTETAKN